MPDQPKPRLKGAWEYEREIAKLQLAKRSWIAAAVIELVALVIIVAGCAK